MKRLVLISIVLAGIATGTGPDIPEANKVKLKEILAVLDGTGEKEYKEPKFYGKDLWRYINGAAEAYHAYDFIILALQRYKSGDRETTIEIYDMGTPLNAFGIYAAERSPELNFIDIGTQGYAEPQMLNFYQGMYYIKLTCSETAGSENLLKNIALNLSETMGENGDIPDVFRVFPPENRLVNTERYLKIAPMNYPFPAPAYQVSYKKDNNRFEIVISEAGDTEKSTEQFARIRNHYIQSGTVTDLQDKTFLCKNTDEGQMICSIQNNFVIIMRNPPDTWRMYIDKINTNLKKRSIDN